jgi:2-octaprenyl-6-methoxyphenol hydroxylase
MHYDLIIVGGGLVGTGLLHALQSSSLTIALIDAKDQNVEDHRLFALNASSCHFLENIKLWDALKDHASPIHKVHVSYQGRFGSLSLSREELALRELGHVIPAKYIEAAFKEKLSSKGNRGFSLYNPAHLKALKIVDQLAYLTIQTENGDVQLTTPLVIAADGTHSTIRKELDIPTEFFDYGQSAIVTQTTLQREHHQVAYERFNSEGAIAMLPLQGNTCATIWTIDHAKADLLMKLSDEEFLALLSKTFGYRLGRMIATSQRYRYPLQKVLAKKSHHQNVLLIGNALHTLHPIAAQGFNLAIYEVAKLTEKIIEKSKSSFTQEDLQKTSEEMKKQQAISVSVSHHLIGLFNQSNFPPALLSLGMFFVDLMRPLKKRFLEQLLSRRGKVPRLLIKSS